MRTQGTAAVFSIVMILGFGLDGVAQQALRPASLADQSSMASCAQFMAPKKNVNGKMVGQENCLMQDHGLVDPERKYHRVDMGITGTLSGWIVKEGARSNHFTSAPDFVFTQMGNHRPRFHGILRYEAEKGTSLILFYPESGWNGKFYVMVHGVGGSFLSGSMSSWYQNFNSSSSFNATKIETAMLEKGYAVARTRRNADRDRPGDYEAVLDNGEVWPGQNINQNPELILDMARLVRNFLKDRSGREATRIYWYGHSAGAHMGFLVNFMPEGNLEPNGKHTVDGILADDPGGGFYVPILMKNGQDVLFRTPEEKAKFVKTFSIAHQLYPNFYSVDQPWQMELATVPSYVSPSYLENKRTAARVFREKNMMSGFRMYEIKGISHNSGDTSPESGRGDVPTLPMVELSRFIDGVVDLLDNWVEKGTEPPGMRSESPGLGDQREAVNLPETACPLGVYFAYPPSQGAGSAGSTAFAPFDGVSLEPVDGRMELVDMNENGKRDKRERVTEAWRRLGLLKPDETLSRAKYVACVQNAVATLRKDNFITEKVGNLYIQEAGTEELPAR